MKEVPMATLASQRTAQWNTHEEGGRGERQHENDKQAIMQKQKTLAKNCKQAIVYMGQEVPLLTATGCTMKQKKNHWLALVQG